eukprot:162411-Amphidinium_carterae.1
MALELSNTSRTLDAEKGINRRNTTRTSMCSHTGTAPWQWKRSKLSFILFFEPSHAANRELVNHN